MVVDVSRPPAVFRVRVPVATPLAPSVEPPPTDRASIRQVELSVAEGMISGGSRDIIDAVDSAFRGRLDLLAVLSDGDIVQAWLQGDKLVAAAAPVGARVMRIGFFTGSVEGWFDEVGMGMDGRFRSRPVFASRITSHYGVRFHPVDGTVKPHKGTDYGAPIGTAVHSTGFGTVRTLAENASAGRHITLLHADGAETLYLHLSDFVPQLRVGDVVQAGQVIGFVGTTGKSTGPHLHYELRFAGVAVDAPHMIFEGQTALGPVELRAHRAFLNSLP